MDELIDQTPGVEEHGGTHLGPLAVWDRVDCQLDVGGQEQELIDVQGHGCLVLVTELLHDLVVDPPEIGNFSLRE